MDQFQKRTLWVISVLILLWIIHTAQESLFVIYSAFILASAMSPLVELLDRKLPRWVAVLVPFTVFLLLSILVILPTADIAFQELNGLISDMPKYLDQAKKLGDAWIKAERQYPILNNLNIAHILDQLSEQSGAFFSGFTGATIAVSKVLLNMLTASIISFFLLLDREKIQNYALRFLSEDERARADQLINDLIRSTGAFVNGQLLFMASFALMLYVGLTVLGVPFALLFAIFAGTLTIIPILGPNIAMVPTLIFVLINTGDPMQCLWIFLLFVVVQMIENNFVGPLIMGKAVGLHPLAIILSIMTGGVLFGMVGIVLAIPMASCLNILIESWVLKRDGKIPVTDSQIPAARS